MPAANYLTPNMLLAREFAQQALMKPSGVMVHVLSADCGGYREAQRKARSLTTAFHALRSREHRKAMQRSIAQYSKARDSDITGPYDRIACIVQEMPNEQGFIVNYVPVAMLNVGFKVFDIASGEEIGLTSPTKDRCNKIADFFMYTIGMRARKRETHMDPLNAEDRAFWFAHDPVFMREYYTMVKLPFPYADVEGGATTPEAEFDIGDALLNSDPEDMWGGGEEPA